MTNVLVCDSEVMWFTAVKVSIPGTRGEMVEVKTPEVSSFPGWVTHGTVDSV